jgi:hypothetical protein
VSRLAIKSRLVGSFRATYSRRFLRAAKRGCISAKKRLQSYMALGATQDHKDSAVLVEADLKELAESLGQVLRRVPARRDLLRMTVGFHCSG